MNEFKIEEQTYKGDLYEIWSGTHLPTNTQVSIITVDKRNNSEHVDLERFEKFCPFVKSISHPSLLQYYSITQDEDQISVIMEKPTGDNLREFLIKKQDKRISENEARVILRQIVSVAEYLLGFNIVHKNFNLRNIFITTIENGNSTQLGVKVGDFLICNKIKPIYKPHTDTSAYHFYAPETWLDDQTDLSKFSLEVADSWSIGVILYAMICGCYPFGGKHELDIFLNVKRARFTLPKFLSDECALLIRSLLSANPNDRPSISQIKTFPWYQGRTMPSPIQSPLLSPMPISPLGQQQLIKEELESYDRSSLNSSPDLPFGFDQSPSSNPTSPVTYSYESYFDNPRGNSDTYQQHPVSEETKVPSVAAHCSPGLARKRASSLLHEMFSIQKAMSEQAPGNPLEQTSNQRRRSLDLGTDDKADPSDPNKLNPEESPETARKNAAGRQRAQSHSPTRRLNRAGRRRSNSANTPSKGSSIPGFDKIFLPQTTDIMNPGPPLSSNGYPPNVTRPQMQMKQQIPTSQYSQYPQFLGQFPPQIAQQFIQQQIPPQYQKLQQLTLQQQLQLKQYKQLQVQMEAQKAAQMRAYIQAQTQAIGIDESMQQQQPNNNTLPQMHQLQNGVYPNHFQTNGVQYFYTSQQQPINYMNNNNNASSIPNNNNIISMDDGSSVHSNYIALSPSTVSSPTISSPSTPTDDYSAIHNDKSNGILDEISNPISQINLDGNVNTDNQQHQQQEQKDQPGLIPFSIPLLGDEANLISADNPNLDDWIASVLKGQV